MPTKSGEGATQCRFFSFGHDAVAGYRRFAVLSRFWWALPTSQESPLLGERVEIGSGGGADDLRIVVVLLDHDYDVIRLGERGEHSSVFELLNDESATALLAGPRAL